MSGADVSYDGTQVVFAGLTAGTYDRGPSGNPGAWRLYVIGLDGQGLRQLTFDDPARNDLAEPLRAVDDYDPAWLPDGRIVFASTRWPSFSHYGGARTSNLYVIDADGGRLHRITAERNGADRPAVDPVTGRIVFARWWRNHRFPLDRLDSKVAGDGFDWKDGLSAVRSLQLDGAPQNDNLLWRIAWQLATIRPDGTELAMWSGATDGRIADARNHVYGGAFAADGSFYGNFYPMFNMTEASGFGGIRRFTRGPGNYTRVAGITDLSGEYVNRAPPVSFGIYRGAYATDAVPLADGRVLASFAADLGQDYGLYLLERGGAAKTPVYDQVGTAEVRAVRASPRALPPLLADTAPLAASPRPPAATAADGRFDGDGTFVFDALNVYYNAPVDWAIGHAPAIGSAASLRVYVDHQRASLGSYPGRDWPILLTTLPVDAAGAVHDDRAPANVPLFEQLRSADGRVPFMGPAAEPTGAAHVAGLNYGRPGAVVRCVGCHAGHTMIPVPATRAEAAWTNLAPGAVVAVSSARHDTGGVGLTDRVAQRGDLQSGVDQCPRPRRRPVGASDLPGADRRAAGPALQPPWRRSRLLIAAGGGGDCAPVRRPRRHRPTGRAASRPVECRRHRRGVPRGDRQGRAGVPRRGDGTHRRRAGGRPGGSRGGSERRRPPTGADDPAAVRAGSSSGPITA